MHHLGDLIRHLREEAGYGIRELAREAKVDPSSISKLERYKQHQLNPENLARIAQTLGTTADQLLAKVGEELDGPPPRRWPSVEEVVERDRNLTEAQKQTVIAVYRSYVERQ